MSTTGIMTEVQEQVEKFANEIESIDLAQRIFDAVVQDGEHISEGILPLNSDLSRIASQMVGPSTSIEERERAINLIEDLGFWAIDFARDIEGVTDNPVAAVFVKSLNYAAEVAAINPLGSGSFVKEGYQLGLAFDPSKNYSIVATAHIGCRAFTVKGLRHDDEEVVSELGCSKRLIEYLDAQ